MPDTIMQGYIAKDGKMVKTGASESGTKPTTDHNLLTVESRSLPDQHPMKAISGLEDALSKKQNTGDYALKSDIPEKLPNPNSITFTGGATGTYDGSSAVTIDIPQGTGPSTAAELAAVVPGGLTADQNVQAVLDALAKIPTESMDLGYANDGKLHILVGGMPVGNGVKIGTPAWGIKNVLSNCVNSNPAESVENGEIYEATLTANSGFTMDGATVTVTMSGADITADAYKNNTIVINKASGDIVITAEAKKQPVYEAVTFANHAITCGQNTNNYNAWAPNGLQYDDKNDAYLMLQCHSNRHINGTYTPWTLSRVYPDDPTRVDDMRLPPENNLGALWVEDGTWYVLSTSSVSGKFHSYKTSDMGQTWERFDTVGLTNKWGCYKCNGIYYSGDDAESDTYYTSTDLVNWTKHHFNLSRTYKALKEASFCWFKGYVWAFLRTNDAELGHPVIVKSLDGITWEFVSDQLLHSYRSTISAYAYGDWMVVADIERDAGVLHYSRFNGEIVEDLQTWKLYGGDDFHCPVVCANGADTVILEFMAHSYINTGAYADRNAYCCENMMIVGKVGGTKYTVSVKKVPYTREESPADIAKRVFTTYPQGTEFNWIPGYQDDMMIRITDEKPSQYRAALVLANNIVSRHTKFFLYNGDTLVRLQNSANSGYPDMEPYPNQFSTSTAYLVLNGENYVCPNISPDKTFFLLQRRTTIAKMSYTPNDVHPQINNTLPSTANLGLNKRIPVLADQYNFNVYDMYEVTFDRVEEEV